MIMEDYKFMFNNVNIASAFFHINLDEDQNIQSAIIEDCNEEYFKLAIAAGLQRDHIIGHSYFEIMPDHDPRWNYYFYQAAIKRKKVAGEFRSREGKTWIRIAAGPALDKDRCWMTFSDFTEYKNENDRLSELSMIDHLSGVKNRNAYENDLLKLQKEETPVGVILVDLNSLKEVNDRKGHQTGDYMIEKTAKYLTSLLDNDLPYRIGGDEFVILLVGKSEEKTIALLHQIRSSTVVSLSAGASWGDHSAKINELIKKADADMYEDKKHYYQTHSRRADDLRVQDHRTDYERAQGVPIPQVNRMLKGNLKDMAALSDNLPFGFVAIGHFDQGGEILTANAKFYRYCGYDSLAEMMQVTKGRYKNLIYPDDYQVIMSKVSDDQKGPRLGSGHMFFRIVTKNGSLVNAEDYGITVEDPTYGKVYVLYSILDDESENRNVFDHVTGLHERHYLINQLNEQLRYNQSEFGKKTLSIICFNFSDFRVFNDSFGFKQGDIFLIRFANMLKKILQTDRIIRTYADHFVVFYDGDDVIEKVQKVHNQAKQLSGVPVWIEAGIYYWNPQKKDAGPDQCIDYASAALKTIHGNRQQYYAIYTPDIAKRLKRKNYLQTHISEAIEKGWIEIYLQPVIRTLTGKISSYEALSRWRDPVYGMISPAEFVPAIEEKNLSYKLAQFVIDDAARIIAEHQRIHQQKAVPISINLSRRDFESFDPFEKVEEAVRRYEIDRHQIIIEITESTAMEKPELIRKIIAKFHQAGYLVWMDDFGSSYSSLNALKDFEFDEIKLDMYFLNHLNARGKQIIVSCIEMAKKLGIHTLCEGVETKAQLEFLKSIGCEKIQGFYYSEPHSVSDMHQLVENNHMVYETSKEAMLFDDIADVDFEEDVSWFMAVVHDHDIRLLYVSEQFKKQAEAWHMPQLYNIDLQTSSSAMALKMSTVIERTIISGQKEYITYFKDGIYFLITASKLSANNDYTICKVKVTDATKESAQVRLAYATPLVQSLVSMYDSIYYIDYQAMTLEVVSSDFVYENIGTKVPFDPIISEKLIAVKDHKRFLRWINKQSLHAYFADPAHRYICAAFSVCDTIHGTQAIDKVFTIIPKGDQPDHYLLCLSNPS